MRRDNFYPGKCTRLCSKHFRHDDYMNFGRKTLKSGSIPSICTFPMQRIEKPVTRKSRGKSHTDIHYRRDIITFYKYTDEIIIENVMGSIYQNPTPLRERNGFTDMQPPVRTLKSETKQLLNQLPEKPKRPLTPYIQYLKEKQPIVAKENPNMKQADILKRIAIDWKDVSDEQKEKYSEKFESESKSYHVAILNYNSSLTTEQQEVLKNAATEKKEERKKRKMKQLIKDTNKPKKPMGPYILFLKEECRVRNIPFKDAMSTLKGEWEKLSEAEKSGYKERYLVEKKKYEKALMEWEQQMVAEGHSELVKTKLATVDTNKSRILSLKKDKEPHQ